MSHPEVGIYPGTLLDVGLGGRALSGNLRSDLIMNPTSFPAPHHVLAEHL